MWKKGDKVVRIYGSDSWSRNGMRPGEVGTLKEDQMFPGVVKLEEYPDAVGHDVMRLRRLSDYPQFKPKELAQLWQLVNEKRFEAVVDFIKFLPKRRVKEAQ